MFKGSIQGLNPMYISVMSLQNNIKKPSYNVGLESVVDSVTQK